MLILYVVAARNRQFTLILDVFANGVGQFAPILDIFAVSIVARSATKNGVGKWIGAIKINHGGRRREGQRPNAKKQTGGKDRKRQEQ